MKKCEDKRRMAVMLHILAAWLRRIQNVHTGSNGAPCRTRINDKWLNENTKGRKNG